MGFGYPIKALTALSLTSASGSTSDEDGLVKGVAGRLKVPPYLDFLEPLVITPSDANHIGAVGVLVVVVKNPSLVTPVASAIQSVLSADDPSKVSISTSESFATLRGLVQQQLGAFGRGLTTVVFGSTGVLVAALLYGLVTMRRKDFGRRRALGATRSLIVVLLLLQMTMLSIAGAVLGDALAMAVLAAGHAPLPGFDFVASVSVLAVAIGLAAATIPAISAARRDPIRELRVP